MIIFYKMASLDFTIFSNQFMYVIFYNHKTEDMN